MTTFTFDAALAGQIAPTGTLRVALNMGNPVLASSNTAGVSPAGVTIDLARELSRLLDIGLDLIEFKTAADALQSVLAGDADVGFMAIDPNRADGIHFTGAYVEILGSYVVPAESPIRHNDEVDSAGNDLVVGEASAYDLFLTRNIKHANIVRVPFSEQVIEAMVEGGYAAGAGVRQQLESEQAKFPQVRLLDGGFMVIRQACIVPVDRSAAACAAMDSFIEWARASSFVRESLDRHGIEGAQIASKA